jgi:hypothetical protein
MDTAAAGAHSVYNLIERTAEPVSNGVRWKTINYENTPHYYYDVFTGSGGISFFLAEYYRQTHCAKALDLAIGANQWCWECDEFEPWSRGIHFGKTGLAMAWLHLSQITQESEYLSYCLENAEIILQEDPGPFTDLMGGAASNGVLRMAIAVEQTRLRPQWIPAPHGQTHNRARARTYQHLGARRFSPLLLLLPLLQQLEESPFGRSASQQP